MRLKILRAMADMEEMQRLGKDYLDTEPHGLGFELYREGGEPRVLARLVVKEPPPMVLSVLAGEAAYHVRGALDHLVYQLALLNGSRPTGTQFPLMVDERVYRTPRKGKPSPRDAMLAGLTEEQRQIIDEFQPFHDGPDAERNPLVVIGRFANYDKHRAIQTAAGWPDPMSVEPNVPGVDLDVRFADLEPPLQHGAPLFSVRVVPGFPDVPMRYSIRFTLAYGTGKIGFVSRTLLTEAAQRVHDIIGEVERRVPALTEATAGN